MSENLVRFWGVRGSVPAPLTTREIENIVGSELEAFAHSTIGESATNLKFMIDEFIAGRKAKKPFTYGGNTSCVEVRCAGQIIVLDMGTGLRPLGNALFPEMFRNKGLDVTFLTSHVHWDHIQGLPFFGPLYVNKETGIRNKWHFLGGTDWQKRAEDCLRGQMDPPTFPVSWDEILKTTAVMEFSDVYDRKSINIGDGKITFRKLNHPQETYGSRICFPDGKIVVYSTDNEPYDPDHPDPRLVDLAMGADLWITDCQYTRDQYNGKDAGGVPRHSWGHSYPEAVVATAMLAGVKKVVLFHHDPNSSDARISEMEAATKSLLEAQGAGHIEVVAAYEGLEFNLD